MKISLLKIVTINTILRYHPLQCISKMDTTRNSPCKRYHLNNKSHKIAYQLAKESNNTLHHTSLVYIVVIEHCKSRLSIGPDMTLSIIQCIAINASAYISST